MIEGLDISQYQGSVNWDLVPFDRYQFVIMRVSVGQYTLDARFAEYYEALKDRPVELGFYLVFVETQDGTAQADAGMDRIEAVVGAAPKLICIDFERDDGVLNATSRIRLHDMIYRLRERATWTWEDAWQPVIYTSKSKWDALAIVSGNSPAFADEMELWVAHYFGLDQWKAYKDGGEMLARRTTTPQFESVQSVDPRPSLPEPWTLWRFWQYSSSLAVPGFPGNVDHNFFRGSIHDLRFRTGKINPFGKRLVEVEKKAHTHE